MKIYHNPRCSKSREALQLLREKGMEPEVIEYLKQPLSPDQLKSLLMKLNMKAEELIRKNEKFFKQQFKGVRFSEEEWIQVLSQHPLLIERPVIEKEHKAIIARPPEKALELL